MLSGHFHTQRLLFSWKLSSLTSVATDLCLVLLQVVVEEIPGQVLCCVLNGS